MDIGQLFAWVQTLLQNLGVWDLLGVVINIALITSAAAFVIRVLRSGS